MTGQPTGPPGPGQPPGQSPGSPGQPPAGETTKSGGQGFATGSGIPLLINALCLIITALYLAKFEVD